MRCLAPLLLLLPLPLLAQNDPTVEPPTMLEVTVGGSTRKVAEGESFDVNGTPVVARLGATRTLNTGGFSFEYPRHFAFEFDGANAGMQHWTLDGNNVVVMVFEVDGQGEVKDFEEGMIEQFGRKNCRPSNTSLKLGGKAYTGRRLDIEMAGAKLSLDMVKLEGSGDRSRFLFVQDTKNDDGTPSAERTETVRVIDRSIAYH
ncbi:MAG: hypothetical protein JNL05_02380 [Flavobacteriales bacterium]|nr:hypothetical protein [Flavobacteriales bacterium]